MKKSSFPWKQKLMTPRTPSLYVSSSSAQNSGMSAGRPAVDEALGSIPGNVMKKGRRGRKEKQYQ